MTLTINPLVFWTIPLYMYSILTASSYLSIYYEYVRSWSRDFYVVVGWKLWGILLKIEISGWLTNTYRLDTQCTRVCLQQVVFYGKQGLLWIWEFGNYFFCLFRVSAGVFWVVKFVFFIILDLHVNQQIQWCVLHLAPWPEERMKKSETWKKKQTTSALLIQFFECDFHFNFNIHKHKNKDTCILM